MNGLGAIIVGIGLQDGLNPCIFMTCAFFIVQGLWLKIRSLPVFWFRVIFLLVYALCSFAYNFGPIQVFVFHKYFILGAKIVYFLLGVWALILGVQFFKDWFLLSRGLPVADLADKKVKSSLALGLVVFLVTVALAVLLSAIATLWPINTYLMLLGNEAIMKGQWQMVISLLASYVLISMWPLWLLWAFLSVKKIRPSLLKIICAAIFFTASTVIIFVFK